jgi:tRNA(Ile)-lysidine synthase
MESALLTRFQRHLTDSGLLESVQAGALVAWSGGLDSTVLVHLLYAAGMGPTVAHCNFQLRGAESDEEEFFVQKWAKQWNIPCFCQKMDTLVYARDNGVSIQMAARTLRYQWFHELLEAHGLACLLTAHHANDNAETMLIHLLRGSGIKGLAGIPPMVVFGGNYTLARPLLPFSRLELEQYAQEQHLEWRDDSSNLKDDYLRNHIRHHVVPQLETAQAAFWQNTTKTSDILRSTHQNYLFLLEHQLKWAQPEPGQYTLDLAAVRQLPTPDAALWELLNGFGFTPEQTRQMAASLDRVGQTFQADNGARVLMDRKHLIVSPEAAAAVPEIRIHPDDLMVKVPDWGILFFTETNDTAAFPDGKTAILVDKNQVKFPLTLRPWQAGDVFQPFGMQGRHQKLQDFFINQKLSRLDKERVRLLVNGDGNVIWVAGWRMDERFRVPKSADSALKITLIT